MPRTQKRWLSDQPMVEGQIFIPFGVGDVTSGSVAAAITIPIGTNVGTTSPVYAGNVANTFTTTGSATSVTNATISGSGVALDPIASGNFPLQLSTAGTAYVMDKWLSSLMFRTGMEDDLQEAFGGQKTTFTTNDFPGARGLASPPNTFTTPAGVSGPPPFTGLSQFTPVTASRPKGIQINSVTCFYEVGAVNTTLNTIAIYQTAFANGVAPAVTTILAASNLTATHATTPYATTVALSSPAMLTTQNAAYSLEWKLTTGESTGTALIWGVQLNVSYNFQ